MSLLTPVFTTSFHCCLIPTLHQLSQEAQFSPQNSDESVCVCMCGHMHTHVPVYFSDVRKWHCSSADMAPPFIKCSDTLQKDPHLPLHVVPVSLGRTESIYALLYSSTGIPFLNLNPANSLTFKISPTMGGLLRALS